MKQKLKQKQLQQRILQSLGYNNLDDGPELQRTKKQLRSDQLSQQLAEITQKSQKKRRRINETISGINSRVNQESQEMKQLTWRLQVLRQDRKQRQKNKDQQISFDELYKRQKNKYLKFRDRQKIKVSDPKYLEMIGSMQLRREKRKMQSMQKIEKHIEYLDINIENHTENGKGSRNLRKKG